jgi:hypothetical protein
MPDSSVHNENPNTQILRVRGISQEPYIVFTGTNLIL